MSVYAYADAATLPCNREISGGSGPGDSGFTDQDLNRVSDSRNFVLNHGLGVVHDLNNLFQVVLGWSDVILSSGTMDHEAGQRLEKIRLAATEASGIARRFLVSRGEEQIMPQPMNLAATVHAWKPVLEAAAGPGVEFEIAASDEGRNGGIVAVEGWVLQILLNLISNACTATGNVGKIAVGVETGSRDGRDVVELSVSDSGTGMDADAVSRIFEPGFTMSVKGHGQGMATVKSMAELMGAQVNIASQPGAGTRVTVEFIKVA